MPFADLIHGSALQGDAARLDLGAATRLGRAFGTALRRHTGGGSRVVVVARSDDGGELPLRDGLVRGLVLTGHDVRDLGVVDERVFVFSLGHQNAAGGVLVQPGGDRLRTVSFTLGRRPLAGDALAELAGLADGDDFSAGSGTLRLVDAQGAFRAAGVGGTG